MLGAHSMRLAQVLLRMMVATMRQVVTYAVGCWPQGYPDCALSLCHCSPAEEGFQASDSAHAFFRVLS